ncbi:TPA: polysaccharide deacetylase family protein [Streptococcus agalactiae]|nr:polysaccharide deacetylase family protein [Streptococcus agalactiae]
MKKLIIGIFSLIIIAILAWQGFSFLKHKEIKLQQAVVEKEIRIAEKTVEVVKRQKTERVLFLEPKGYDKSLSADILKWNQKSFEHKKFYDNQYIILRPQLADSNFANVKKLSIYQILYQKEKGSMFQKSSRLLRTYLLDQNKKPFELDELLAHNISGFKAILENIAPGTQLKEHDSNKEFLKTGRVTDGLDVKDGKLIINDLKLPLDKLYNVIDESYLKSSDLDLVSNLKAKAPRVALTFDDGPNEKTTPKALEILKRYNAKATFFVMGQSAVGHTDILKRMHAEGHEIGNHTWDHPNLTKLPAEKIKEEIHKTNDLIMKATGQKPVYLRPPYGATNATVKTVTGLKEMLWSVDIEDWKNHNTQAMMTNIKKQLRPGGVILMHDIHQTSIDALPTIMDYLITQGYYFVTVGELYSTP